MIGIDYRCPYPQVVFPLRDPMHQHGCETLRLGPLSAVQVKWSISACSLDLVFFPSASSDLGLLYSSEQKAIPFLLEIEQEVHLSDPSVVQDNMEQNGSHHDDYRHESQFLRTKDLDGYPTPHEPSSIVPIACQKARPHDFPQFGFPYPLPSDPVLLSH
jgi:hypothetical protein